MATVTRFEVQRFHPGDIWGPLWGDGPVRFATRREADAEAARLSDPRFRCRVVPVSGVLLVTRLDLEEFVVPLVARFWRLHAPGQERGRALEVVLDKPRREQVQTDWARLSAWEGRAIVYAPEVELPRLWKRFPFARPRTVEGVLRLLTLHELGHYVCGHSTRPRTIDGQARTEAEADALARVWWRDGLTRVPKPNAPRRAAA